MHRPAPFRARDILAFQNYWRQVKLLIYLTKIKSENDHVNIRKNYLV
jgi:hypothetical protein